MICLHIHVAWSYIYLLKRRSKIVDYIRAHVHVRQFLEVPMYLYGELSSKFEEFLAMRSQFDSDNGVDFPAPTCCLSAIFVRPLFVFYCPLFFTIKKKCGISPPTRCLRCATDGSAKSINCAARTMVQVVRTGTET